MTAVLDTGVVVSLLDEKHPAHDWCAENVAMARAEGPLIISDIVYCELSMGMRTKEEIDIAIFELALERMPESDEALIRAGAAFKKYKHENAGPKTGVLPDFLIGSLAEVAGAALITINPRDFVGYFPHIDVRSP